MVILSLCGEKYTKAAPETFLDKLLVRIADELKTLVHPRSSRHQVGLDRPA